MTPSTIVVDAAGLAFEAGGALLGALVLLYVYRQSRILCFGFWALAWGLAALAAMAGYELVERQSWPWLAAHAAIECAFVLALVRAAGRPLVFGAVGALPACAAPLFSGWPARLVGYRAAQAVVLAAVLIYHALRSDKHRGIGARVFRFSLLLMAAAPLWRPAVDRPAYYDFALDCAFAIGALAMWSESQADRIRDLAAELDHARRANGGPAALDRLTGLLNQSALSHRIETCAAFAGAVAVCDMDSFKEINDRYGHLVGDEILRHVGHLLRSSIRPEDQAFRWGGDEFVVVFHEQLQTLAGARMAAIEARLRGFQVRGEGVLPISFSWGTADGGGRSLRETLDEADRKMYQHKRSRAIGLRATSP
ncbi:MAG TPA: GGDEF domain-containing protein [Bryobacteraceae bacterium]|nr:GGDEF domain-containing protein [Bryobacteraceae bacterium]